MWIVLFIVVMWFVLNVWCKFNVYVRIFILNKIWWFFLVIYKKLNLIMCNKMIIVMYGN